MCYNKVIIHLVLPPTLWDLDYYFSILQIKKLRHTEVRSLFKVMLIQPEVQELSFKPRQHRAPVLFSFWVGACTHGTSTVACRMEMWAAWPGQRAPVMESSGQVLPGDRARRLEELQDPKNLRLCTLRSTFCLVKMYLYKIKKPRCCRLHVHSPHASTPNPWVEAWAPVGCY